jgi:SAM-dependent methyltransferase
MKSFFRALFSRLTLFGFDLKKFSRSVRTWPVYRRERAEFRRQAREARVVFAEGREMPFLLDRRQAGGSAKGAYFNQDIWVARKILERNPRRHLDVGSRVDGFIAHVAVFREIEIIDIRPLQTSVKNIKVAQADLSAPLPDSLRSCCDSLSCLHALEHFGLGRYGDPIKYDGYLDGLQNLHAILAPGGKFYFSVPVGPQRVEFNAHRAFSASYLWELLSPLYAIDGFAFVDDAGDLHDVDLKSADLPAQIDANFGCNFGCAIFDLTKR